MVDGGEVIELEGMLHFALVWGLSDYGVIGMLWTEGAEEVPTGAKRERCSLLSSFCVTQWLCGVQSFGQFGAWLLMKRRSWGTRLGLHK